MKRLLLSATLASILPFPAFPAPLSLPNEVATTILLDGDNVRIEVRCPYVPSAEPSLLPLVSGPVALQSASRPPSTTLFARDETILLYDSGRRTWLGKPSPSSIHLQLVARGSPAGTPADNDAGFRTLRFSLLPALIHRLTVQGDRPDVEITLGSGVQASRERDLEGRPIVKAFLPVGPDGRCPVEIRWKDRPRKTEGELVASCEAHVIASTTVGALRLDHLFIWRVAQGTIQQLAIRVPDGVPITEVAGPEIQDWHLETRPDGEHVLRLTLRRPWEGAYRLQVRAERPLPQLPCSFELPVLQPLGVLRTSGFLLVGAETAVKLSLRKTAGLTQMDLYAFPTVELDSSSPPRPKPNRYTTAWQYANLPYLLVLDAEDIVPEYGSEDRLVLTVGDSDLSLAVSSELEVREAPLREATIRTDPAWSVASIVGNAIADYDVRDQDGVRLIHLYFKTPLLGRTLLQLRLERSLPLDAATFLLPPFVIAGAKEQRGYLVAAAEKGLQLSAVRTKGLREAQIGAVPVRVPDAQLAWRIREAAWSAELGVVRTRSVLHSEIFTLGSMGEGVLYESATFTFFISGAPVRTLRVRIPSNRRNVEFSGRSIRSWSREGDLWTIVLQERVLGSYSLLATFDQPLDYESGDFRAGGLTAADSENEVGYLVLAGEAHLVVAPKDLPPTYIPLDHEEIPPAYSLLIQNPVAAAYKHLGPGSEVAFAFTRFRTERLLDQVVDHLAIETRLSRNGEALTRLTAFVKNASQQYLPFQLPSGVTLWTVKTAPENQTLREVAPLRGQNAILVPLERLRDPNTPLQVEITCASTSAPLGRFGATLAFSAPTFPTTPTVYTRWTISAPDHAWRLRWVGGSMTPQAAVETGFWQVLTNVASLWAAATIGLPLVAIPAASLLAGLALFLFAAARRRGLGSALILALLLLFLGFLAGSVATALWKTDPTPYLARVAISAGQTETSASRILVASEDEPLHALCRVTPVWSGAVGPSWTLGAWPIAAFLLFLLARWIRKGSSFLALLGFLALSLALADWTLGRGILTVLAAAGFPLWLVLRILSAAWNAGELRRRSEETPPSVPPSIEPPQGQTHGAGPALLLLVLLFTTASESARAETLPPPAPPPIRLEEMRMEISAPPLSRHADPAVPILAHFRLYAEQPGRLFILGLDSNTVLSFFQSDSPRLRPLRQTDALEIEVDRPGSYRFHLSFFVSAAFAGPAADDWRLAFRCAKALDSEIQVRVPQRQIEFHSIEGAAHQTLRETDAETSLIFRPSLADQTTLGWKTRARRTELEEAAFSAEILTTAIFEPGVAELTARTLLQITRGQLATLSFDIPAGFSVTAVSASGLDTWRFDSDSRRLELLFAKPLAGAATFEILLQIPQDGLPYETTLAPLTVVGAERQRGALALAVPDSIQFSILNTDHLSPLAIEDFPGPKPAGTGTPRSLKRAYRYHQPPAAMTVRVEAVLPEIRVEEKSTLSISDDRTVLSAQFELHIARAGAFAVTLLAPEGYEIESLSGTDVSHWEDVWDGTNRMAIVRFQKQAIGDRRLQGVFSRTARGLESALRLPRITVREAVKHTGTRIVSAERGVRLSTESRDGALEINPREVGVLDPRALAFSILRPHWSVTLNVETLAPLLKPEMLHTVYLAEGTMQETVWIRYAIENAGSKTFRIRAPKPGIALSVSGRGVAKVFEADPAAGIWQIELVNKAEQRLLLRLACQRPFDPAQGRLTIEPFRPLDAENPKGWLTISASERLQIRPAGDEVGLNPEDSRAIPTDFGAGDRSDAILTYRAVIADYRLTLDILRHGSAETLPARVREVRLESAVGEQNRLLTTASLAIEVGDRRFLTMTLPGATDRLWSVFVNGKVSRPSREGRAYRIPLERAPEGEATTVHVLYSSENPAGIERKIPAPAFDLPLHNVTWVLYMRSDRLYWGVGGDFTPRQQDRSVLPYNLSRYRQASLQQYEESLQKAKVVLARGEEFQQKGAQRDARQALEEAVVLTQGKADYNEDARIQYLNLVRQQALVGLAQRRAEFEREKSATTETASQAAVPSGFNAGNFTPDFVRKLEQSLPGEETAALQALAEKIISQQQAAMPLAPAIRIALPEEGVRLVAARPMAIQPNASLVLSLRSIPKTPARRAAAGAGFTVVLLTAFVLLRRILPNSVPPAQGETTSTALKFNPPSS